MRWCLQDGERFDNQAPGGRQDRFIEGGGEGRGRGRRGERGGRGGGGGADRQASLERPEGGRGRGRGHGEAARAPNKVLARKLFSGEVQQVGALPASLPYDVLQRTV